MTVRRSVSCPREDAPLFRTDLAELHRRRSVKWSVRPDVLPASIAEMDFPLAPCVAGALHAAIDRGDCGYASAAGLRQGFADWCARRLGWRPDPHAIVILPDVLTAISQALQRLTAPGDAVVIMPPVYQPFWHVIADAGRRAVEVPLTDGRIDHAGVAAALRHGARAILLCSPHNPTGAVWSAGDVQELSSTADRYGALVISDEIHAALTLPGVTFTSYGSLPATRAVIVTSLSKAFNIAGLKCAFAVGCSPEATAALAGIARDVRSTTGHLGVLATEAALHDGDEWLDALREQIASNHRLLARLLAERLPLIGYEPPQASYLAWLDCRALGLGDDPAAAFLAAGGVSLVPGPDYGRQGAGHARLNIGTSPQLIAAAVERMAAAVG